MRKTVSSFIQLVVPLSNLLYFLLTGPNEKLREENRSLKDLNQSLENQIQESKTTIKDLEQKKTELELQNLSL